MNEMSAPVTNVRAVILSDVVLEEKEAQVTSDFLMILLMIIRSSASLEPLIFNQDTCKDFKAAITRAIHL
jgi:hypothetical protein